MEPTADSTTIHKYPGLGLPLRNDSPSDFDYGIGAHPVCYGTHSELVNVREIAMMSVMDKLTDKPDWHKKVFDDEIATKWRDEALAVPNDEFYHLATNGKRWDGGNDSDHGETPEGIMSEAAFDVCVKELRDKAKYFEQTGIIPTLDACASIAKSDSLVTHELQQALRSAFDTLRLDQKGSPDWHPNSGDMVQDLVHPSMYPLVYGRTRVFNEECVGTTDAVGRWAGKGIVIPKDNMARTVSGSYDQIPPEFWSETYQWLPANVAFQDDGSVRFTSYINNLHPVRYSTIYSTIEQLIQTSLPLWDQCLFSVCYGAGRTEPRMEVPENPDDDNQELWIPDHVGDYADVDVDPDALFDEGYEEEDYEPGEAIQHIDFYKWKVLRKPKLPEPSHTTIDYTPRDGERLVHRFRELGLQILVKMASIELTPEKPEFPTGGWHVEGQMNEHICATALYYLDSENITDSSLSFRMHTPRDLHVDGVYYQIQQDNYRWMEAVFGTKFGNRMSPCLQNYGSVNTPEGRLLAFSNAFQHRVSGFRLSDPTKPGHRRFIALWLVDPAKRIISTANVPPQQMSWYTDATLGTSPESRKAVSAKLPAELVELIQELDLNSPSHGKLVGESRMKLPQELMDMVRELLETDGESLPMSIREAREHRVKLMTERGAFIKKAGDEWQKTCYSFCEH
ncbi:hypothetical protein FB567DRAFT_545535 [Paraphoma chrysanthemicola]|uniref:Uncharacterized protein n=1 Tax=Paraphoma chrysanthemicola TaxID=798071 RepID=A0A8K0RGL1_9PLEO|nr:hypothetical protein FB567DRAFT_545535 [Paraphoma chrysanthemicola]